MKVLTKSLSLLYKLYIKNNLILIYSASMIYSNHDTIFVGRWFEHANLTIAKPVQRLSSTIFWFSAVPRQFKN